MAEQGVRIPWRVWFRLHGKAIAQALPAAFIVVVEGRDLYLRATWEVAPTSPTQFNVGDVVLLSNRWYTLPTWKHVFYSFLCKALFKTSWDDVAVITGREDNVPYVMYCDFAGAHRLPLSQFLEERRPRGAALRKLDRPVSEPPLSHAVASLFEEEVIKIPPKPWHVFSASHRTGDETKLYNTCVAMSEQRRKLVAMRERKQSQQAVAAQQGKLKEMEPMKEYYAGRVKRESEFFLFNGSLVSSFLATFGLLDREMPPPSSYVPQDFAHELPFTGVTTLLEPVVFYKD